MSVSADALFSSRSSLTTSSSKLSRTGASTFLGSKSYKHERAGRTFPNTLLGRNIIELTLSARNLPKMDVFGLSDPFVVVYLLTDKNAVKMGMTETVWYSLDPTFVQPFDIPADAPLKAKVKCEVYDRDNMSDQLSNHDYIGCTEITIEDLLNSNDEVTKKIVNADMRRRVWRAYPELTFRVTKMNLPDTFRRWEFSVRIADICRPDKNHRVFFEIYRSEAAPSEKTRPNFSQVLYRSEVATRDNEYFFESSELPVERIIVNRTDRLVRLDIMRHKKRGAHYVLGSFELPFKDVLTLKAGDKLDLKSRKQVKAGEIWCKRSLIGNDTGGKVYSTYLEIVNLNFDDPSS